MRKTTALLAAFAVLAALTSCANSDTVAGCAPAQASGAASSVVKAPGAVGTKPKVSIPTPLYTKTTQRSVIKQGTGSAIQSGQPVIIDVTILNGRTDVALQTTDYGKVGGSIITAGKSTLPALSEGLVCATVGSRVAIVANAKDGHQGKADSSSGIKKNDAIVFVVDVRAAYPAKAAGALQVSSDKYPSVVTTSTGAPGITIPDSSAPTSLSTEILQAGGGTKVKKGDYAIVKYTEVTWAAKSTVVQSTWKSDDQADVLQVGATTVSTGLSTALTGKRVGSQLLVVVPPKLAASSDGSVAAPATSVVYVIDILGIVK